MASAIRPTCKKFLWNCYDHLGRLILGNLLWFVVSLPIVTLPASTAGLFYMTLRMVEYQDASLLDFFRGFHRFFWKSLALLGVTATVLIVLVVNVYFYGTRLPWPWLAALLGGIMLWLVVFWGLVQVYLFPLLVKCNPSLWVIFKQSALLVLDNLGLSLLLTLFTLLLLGLGLVSIVGLLGLSVAVVSVLWNTALRELLHKYQQLEARDQGLSSDAEEEPRTWRDLLRPWEM